MGSDESHFNVSVGSDGQSHKTVSTNHGGFEEKAEAKRYRTDVLPLTRPNRVTPLLFVWSFSYNYALDCFLSSPGEIKRREVSWTLTKKLDAFAGPGQIT